MYQKLCVSMMVMLALVVPGIILAQTAPFTVTPVSATAAFNENSGTVLFNSKHSVKIKTGNALVYIPRNGTQLVHTLGKSTPAPVGFASEVNASEVTVGPYREKAFFLHANTEYILTTDMAWDVNHMFAGTYYSALKDIYYSTSSTTSPYDLRYVLDFRTPVMTVVGEKAPYLTSVVPSDPGTVAQGGMITIQGERLSGSKVFVVSYPNGTPVGTPTQLVASTTQSVAQATVPTTLPVGKYLLYLTNASGQSNRYVINVSSATVSKKITNVSVAGTTATSTWVQGVAKKINWTTTGTVPTVDVLVCIEPSNCFFAYKNIANTNFANNVRVGTNIPVGSKAYVKVRQAGTETVAGKSPSFTVVGTTTTSIVPVITLNSVSQSVTAGPLANDDSGMFVARFEVRAEGGDIFVPTKTSGYTYQMQKNGAPVTATSGIATTIISLTTSTTTGAGNVRVAKGTSQKFEFTTVLALPEAGTYGQYRLVLSGIGWDTQDKAILSNKAVVDFKTPYAVLSAVDSVSQVAGVSGGMQGIIDKLKGMFGF